MRLTHKGEGVTKTGMKDARVNVTHRSPAAPSGSIAIRLLNELLLCMLLAQAIFGLIMRTGRRAGK
jgi:hypothetical protein